MYIPTFAYTCTLYILLYTHISKNTCMHKFKSTHIHTFINIYVPVAEMLVFIYLESAFMMLAYSFLIQIKVKIKLCYSFWSYLYYETFTA